MSYVLNMATDRPFLTERVQSVAGMDGYQRPTLIAPEVMALMVNRLVTDNGKCKVRPGFDALGGGVIGAGYTTKIQGMQWHQRTGSQRLVAVCNQNLHNWDGATWSAAIAGWTATAATSLVQIAPMNNKLYLVDGTQRIFEFDGAAFTALAAGDDPQAGASMIVAHADRLFAAGWDGSAVEPYVLRASDLRNAGTGAWHPVNFNFQVGADYSPITALVPMLRNWLVVFKENAIFMVLTDPLQPSAATWNKQEVSIELGCVGKRAAIRVGGDCWFWSQDGIRGITSSVGTEGAFELVAPYSQPMQPYVDRVNLAYKHLICAHRYRDLVFFAVPLDDATEPSHTLVFNARLQQWMGVWSGVAPTCWATTRFTAAAEQLVMGDTAARVNQWKDMDEASLDATYTDNSVAIASTLTTKSFMFGEPDSNKDGDFVEFLFDASFGVNMTLTAYYDTALAKTWAVNESATQNELPLELPFDLAVAGAMRIRKELDSVGDFREVYFTIETTAGNNVFLTASVNAYLESVRDV